MPHVQTVVHIYLIHKWYREDGAEGYLRWENSLPKSNKGSCINYIDFLNWYRRVNFPLQYNIATSLTVHYLFSLFRLTTVSVYGTKYRVGAVVCFGMMMMAYQILHQF